MVGPKTPGPVSKDRVGLHVKILKKNSARRRALARHLLRVVCLCFYHVDVLLCCAKMTESIIMRPSPNLKPLA